MKGQMGTDFIKEGKVYLHEIKKNPTDVCAASDVFVGRNSSFQKWLCYDRNMWCGFSLAINSVSYYTCPFPPLTREYSSSSSSSKCMYHWQELQQSLHSEMMVARAMDFMGPKKEVFCPLNNCLTPVFHYLLQQS